MILPGKFTPANFLLSIIRFVRIISIRPHDQFGTRKLWLHELALPAPTHHEKSIDGANENEYH